MSARAVRKLLRSKRKKGGANRPRYGRATAITAAMPQTLASNASGPGAVSQPVAPASSRPPELPAKPVPPPKPKPAVAPKPNLAQPQQQAAKPGVNNVTSNSQPAFPSQPSSANQPAATAGQAANSANDPNGDTGSFSAVHTSMISEFLGRRPGTAAAKGNQPPAPGYVQHPGSTGTGHKSVTFKPEAAPPSNVQPWQNSSPGNQTYQNAQALFAPTYQNAQPSNAATPSAYPAASNAQQPYKSAAPEPAPASKPLPAPPSSRPEPPAPAPASRVEAPTRPAASSLPNGNRVQMATTKSNLDDINTNIVEMDKAIDDVQFNIERIDSTLDELANYNKRFMTAIDQMPDDEDQEEPGSGTQNADSGVEKRTDAAIRELLNSVDTLKRNTQQRVATSATSSRTNLNRSNEQLLQPGPVTTGPNARAPQSAPASKNAARPGNKPHAGPYTETNIDDAKSYDSDSDDDKKAVEYTDESDSDASTKRASSQQPVYANVTVAPKKPMEKSAQKPSVPVPVPAGPVNKMSVVQKAKLFEAAASGQQINQPSSAPAPTPAPSKPALPPRVAKSPKPTAKPRSSKGSSELLGSSPAEPEYTNQAALANDLQNAKRRDGKTHNQSLTDFVSEDELDDDEEESEDEYYRDDEILYAQDEEPQRLATRGRKNAINETDETATRRGAPKPKGSKANDDARVSARPGSQFGQFRRTRSDHQLASRSSRQFAAADPIEIDSDEAYDEDGALRSGASSDNDARKGRGKPVSSSMRSRRPLPRLPSSAHRPQSSEYSDLDLTAQPTYANQSADLDQRHSDLFTGPHNNYMNTAHLAGKPSQAGAKVQRTRSRSVQDFQRLLKDDSRSRPAVNTRLAELSMGDDLSTATSMMSLADLHGLSRDELERLIRSYLEDRKREKMASMLRALLAERDRDGTLRSLIDQYGTEMFDLVGGQGALSGRGPQRAGTLGSLLASSAGTLDRERLGGRSERLGAARPRDRDDLESVGASTLGIGPGYSSLRMPRSGGLNMSLGSIGDADGDGRLGLSLIAPLRVLRAGPNDVEEPPPAMKPTPKPQPPVNRRAHLFESVARFEELDRHVAEVAQSDDFLTFRSLISELTRTCADDVERCRAIFRWVTTKDLSVIDIDPEGACPPESLLGTLRAVKSGTKSYNDVFRKLCLFAGLHCETIHGVSKGAGYTPGTNVKDNRMFRNTWTAVHLNNEWRIVNAAWGARHLLRYYKRKSAGESAALPVYSGSRSQMNIAKLASSQATLRSQPSRMGTLRADGTLLADAPQGLIKSDDFYFLPDAECYIYEHFPDKKAWQLLKRSITLDDFMRLPILKSNFFNAGLKLKKPYTETLDTRNGRVDIHIEMPRYVGMTATLLNRSDMVEIKGLTLVRTVGAGNECVVTCEPPKIGKYFLNIYVSENWKDDAFLGLTSGFELACSFQIKCADPNLDRLVIGRYPPSLGCLGKTPVADRLGFVPTRDCTDPFVVHTEKDELRIGMLVLPGLKVQHQLTFFDRSGKQMQQCDQYALLQTRNKRASYVIRCPADGYYLLTVYAAELGGVNRAVDSSVDDPAAITDDGTARPASNSQQLECVLRYLIDARKPLKVQAFPKQSSRWVGCYLLEPTTKQLYVDQRCVFRIVAPACSSISVVINGKTWLDLKPGREAVWEARISTGPELGELSVYAKFRSDGGDQLGSSAAAPAADGDDKFVKLLDYEIVSAPLKSKK